MPFLEVAFRRMPLFFFNACQIIFISSLIGVASGKDMQAQYFVHLDLQPATLNRCKCGASS